MVYLLRSIEAFFGILLVFNLWLQWLVHQIYGRWLTLALYRQIKWRKQHGFPANDTPVLQFQRVAKLEMATGMSFNIHALDLFTLTGAETLLALPYRHFYSYSDRYEGKVDNNAEYKKVSPDSVEKLYDKAHALILNHQKEEKRREYKKLITARLETIIAIRNPERYFTKPELIEVADFIGVNQELLRKTTKWGVVTLIREQFALNLKKPKDPEFVAKKKSYNPKYPYKGWRGNWGNGYHVMEKAYKY